jgi:hypothetical protein
MDNGLIKGRVRSAHFVVQSEFISGSPTNLSIHRHKNAKSNPVKSTVSTSLTCVRRFSEVIFNRLNAFRFFRFALRRVQRWRELWTVLTSAMLTPLNIGNHNPLIIINILKKLFHLSLTLYVTELHICNKHKKFNSVFVKLR